MSDPLVSVVLPAYNRSAWVERSLMSALAQEGVAFEVVAVDDGSTDDTAARIAQLAAHDPRLRLVRHPVNRGAQAARNTGIAQARGRWIAFLDSDDEWLPGRLAHSLEAHHRSGAEVVHGECLRSEKPGAPCRPMHVPPLAGDVHAAVLTAPGPVFPALTVRRRCIDAIGGLDETLAAYQEWDTAIRLAARCRFAFVEAPLFVYYQHTDPTISSSRRREAEGWSQVVGKHRDSILAIAGQAALMRHYGVLANKYHALGDRAQAATFCRRRAALARTRVVRLREGLKARLAALGIAPRYAGIAVYTR